MGGFHGGHSSGGSSHGSFHGSRSHSSSSSYNRPVRITYIHNGRTYYKPDYGTSNGKPMSFLQSLIPAIIFIVIGVCIFLTTFKVRVKATITKTSVVKDEYNDPYEVYDYIHLKISSLLQEKMIVLYLNIKNIDTICLKSYADDNKRGQIEVISDIFNEKWNDPSVLFIDDLFDSGNTIAYIGKKFKKALKATIYYKNKSTIFWDNQNKSINVKERKLCLH